MGRAKLLLPWGDGRLVDGVVNAWQAAGVDAVVAVVHADDRELAEHLRGRGVEVIVPEMPPPDMKDSVRIALEFVQTHWQPARADVWLLAPADMPALSPEVIRRVLTASVQHPGQIIIPKHAQRKGHPALFPWPLTGEVAQLAPDEGVNAIIARRPVVFIECGEAALPTDVDTPDDYEK